MHENAISEKVIGCAIEVHKQLGPGLLESVYEEALCYEFAQIHLSFHRQLRVPVKYKSILLATKLRLDLIVEDKVIIDTKSVSSVHPIDRQQLLTYLRLKDVRLGLILNFKVNKMLEGIHRVVNQLTEEDE
jgi:GxxExxY protein